jgi:XrtN system VIT domain protein
MENTTNLPPELLDQSMPQTAAQEQYNPLKDNIFIIGLAFLGLSLGAFLLPPKDDFSHDFFGSFLLQFILVWAYTITLWSTKRLRWWFFGSRRPDYPGTLLLLLLWLVSCFALNREMDIFQPSADWLDWHLGISGLAMLAYAWKDQMSAAARMVLWALLGASLILFLYYAIALVPVCFFGFWLVWFFAMPLHAFVPLVICVYLIIILYHAALEERRARTAVFAGMALPLSVLILFSNAWYQVSSRMAMSAQNTDGSSKSELPRWVNVSQHLEKNWLNGYLLKAVAEGELPIDQGLMGDFIRPAFGGKENDPMMQIAAAISPQPELDELECRKIYASQYDSRLVMEDRLWSGDDLITTEVNSTVMIDPGHRLSYTEKLMTVAQKPADNGRRTLTQEAIYTFFLPNGGAVTALSLWINGVESPAVLTTKSKAETAYNTIVGRERRDPAVVFWQEGDQVRVRVFPVTLEMPRRFKVGITAPLRLENQTLVYENISFDGPPALQAYERDSVYFEGVTVFEDSPLFSKQKQESGATFLHFEGDYRHTWSVVCKAPPLSRSVFAFDGKTYQTQPWNLQTEAFAPRDIYLDVNSAWTENEWDEIREIARDRSLKVALDGNFESITTENEARLFRQLNALRFSLFPFHKVPTPETALVISKSAAPTPLLAELEGSAFGAGIKTMNGGAKLRVFHLGADEDLNTYLRSLRERRDIFCFSGNQELLQKYLVSNTYVQNPENAHRVALPGSGMLIAQIDTVVNGQAPDHLYRLFAYNTVLRELQGRAVEAPEELVRLAEQANVVTPITSLVTLETKEDYQRFDIQKTDGLNTLGNAGSVPEPHEWALISLLVLAGWMARRRF